MASRRPCGPGTRPGLIPCGVGVAHQANPGVLARMGSVTASTRRQAGARPDRAAPPPVPGAARPLLVTGAIAAAAVTITGLLVLTPLVVAGWIAAPHSGLGLPGVVRTATGLWLAAHHVAFTLSGTGRIGMLPLGLVLLPGALLWRAGRWVVRIGELTKLSDLGYAALALAVPYAALCGALALASRSRLASPSLPEAVLAGFLLAFCAGGLGGARALAPWPRLFGLMPPRARSVVLGTAGALAVLCAGGALLAGGSLAAHLGEYRTMDATLTPGLVGGALLALAQLGYVPNAIGWAICYSLGPGFALGASTVVAPTGAALGPLPLFPMLAALPASSTGIPAWVSAGVLALPYTAGIVAGTLVARAAPAPAVEVVPLRGFACGVATGCVIGVFAAFSGGPLGSGRLATVGRPRCRTAPMTGTGSTWIRGRARRRTSRPPAVTRRVPRCSRSRARHRGGSAPFGRVERGDLLVHRTSELDLASLPGRARARLAQAPAVLGHLPSQHDEGQQQDHAQHDPDPGDRGRGGRSVRLRGAAPPGPHPRGHRQPHRDHAGQQRVAHEKDTALRGAERQDPGQAQQRDKQGRRRALLRGGLGGHRHGRLSTALVEGGHVPYCAR